MNSQAATADSTVLARVQHQLEGLKKTSDGTLLYGLIERGLHRYESRGQIERALISFIHTVLRKYSQDPKADPVTRFKARVIQQRLVLQLAPADARAAPVPPALSASEAIAVNNPAPASVVFTAPTPLSPQLPSLAQPPVAMQQKQVAPAPSPTEAPTVNALTPRVAADDRGFDRLLAENRGLLKRIGEQGLNGGDLKDIEGLLLTGIEQLIDGHQQLGANLQRASEYLRIIQTDRQQLQRQLHQVRSQSLIDDVTGLPNRAALMRSLAAEIGRARRYATPLTVALLDIDGFADIEANLGRDASEQVLLAYSDQLLSQFRAYDIVSRYGDDAFAILFPNTDAAGAQRALEKLRAQAATMRIALGGNTQALPSFCAVVAPYVGNEKPAALLRRAGQSLAERLTQGRTPPIHILLDA